MTGLHRLNGALSPVALALGIAIEQGRFDGPLARGIARLWTLSAARRVVRRLALPANAVVVSVGGATLGGSGKTPLAIACAAELAGLGARVAFVGHAYRATPRRARAVSVDDRVEDVGDEALLAARALATAGVGVFVAPTRRQAIALAATRGDVIVIDGVSQTRPVRTALAILAVDATEPWGRARAVPPLGDLRAPRDVLLAACDIVVPVGDAIGGARDPWHARAVSSGAWDGATMWTWDDLARARVGLFCALARPERVVRSLASRGVTVRAIVRARDHGPATLPFAGRSMGAAHTHARPCVDVWLMTRKCALHFPAYRESSERSGFILTGAAATIDYELVLSERVRARLRAIAVP